MVTVQSSQMSEIPNQFPISAENWAATLWVPKRHFDSSNRNCFFTKVVWYPLIHIILKFELNLTVWSSHKLQTLLTPKLMGIVSTFSKLTGRGTPIGTYCYYYLLSNQNDFELWNNNKNKRDETKEVADQENEKAKHEDLIIAFSVLAYLCAWCWFKAHVTSSTYLKQFIYSG